MREHFGEELSGRKPLRALNERNDLRDRPSVAMDDQRLAGLDPSQHAAGVVTKVADRDDIHVAECSGNATLIWVPRARPDVSATSADNAQEL
jgi:hypothetical protein